jgi:hypothetical protein
MFSDGRGFAIGTLSALVLDIVPDAEFATGNHQKGGDSGAYIEPLFGGKKLLRHLRSTKNYD